MDKGAKESQSRIVRYKKYILIATGFIGAVAVLLSNITAISSFFKSLTHKQTDDIVIVDNVLNESNNPDTATINEKSIESDKSSTQIEKTDKTSNESGTSSQGLSTNSIQAVLKKDTLEFRLLNKGSSTVSLREAQVLVNSTWEIARFNCYAGFDFLSQVYQVPLFDLQKPYVLEVPLNQSLKPNEVDRFAFVLGGGAKIDADQKQMQLIYDMHRKGLDKNIEVKGFKLANYFLQFRVRFLLNNSPDYIESNSLLHYFGSLQDISMDAALKCKDTSILKFVVTNNQIARMLSKKDLYKSSNALESCLIE